MAAGRMDAQEALQFAIQMEIDGKEFYLKASRNSSNELGRKLLRTLAKEEDSHRLKFEQIFRAITSRKPWPETGFRADGGQRLRTVFAEAMGGSGPGRKSLTEEMDAVRTAMGMENKTHDFYASQAEGASVDAEKEFYETLAAEEKEHYLVLLDYFEYIKDPTGWFTEKEHPSLDGG